MSKNIYPIPEAERYEHYAGMSTRALQHMLLTKIALPFAEFSTAQIVLSERDDMRQVSQIHKAVDLRFGNLKNLHVKTTSDGMTCVSISDSIVTAQLHFSTHYGFDDGIHSADAWKCPIRKTIPYASMLSMRNSAVDDAELIADDDDAPGNIIALYPVDYASLPVTSFQRDGDTGDTVECVTLYRATKGVAWHAMPYAETAHLERNRFVRAMRWMGNAQEVQMSKTSVMLIGERGKRLRIRREVF